MSAPPNLVMAVGPQTTELTVSFALTTSQSAGTIVQGTIAGFGPLVPASATITIPSTEVWHIIDMYVVGGPAAADGEVITIVNGYPQNIAPKLSSLNLNLLTRFRLTLSIPLAPNTTFSSSLSLLATPSANATQILTYKVVRAPFTG